MNFNTKCLVWLTFSSALILTGCSKKTPVNEQKPEVKTESTTPAPLTTDLNCTNTTWSDSLQTDLKDKFTTLTLANLNASEHSYDSSEFKQWNQSIHFKISGIRTDKTSSTDNKVYCTAILTAEFPLSMLVHSYQAQNRHYNACQDIDYACMRQSLEAELTEQELAIEGNQISQSYNYSIAKTDNGESIISRNTDPALSSYLRDMMTYGLYLAAYIEEEAEAREENQEINAEQDAKYKLIGDAMDIRLNEINEALAKRTGQLNTLWESKSKEFQQANLDNQKAWFKKRDIECKIESQKPYDDIAKRDREQYAFNTEEWTQELSNKDQEIRFKKCVNEWIDYRMNQLAEMK
ncbi:MAG: hypothetical protein EOO69_02430 [Moraxellaceae bacterium]|nr:MAG: hypothetical protein EOO69_02430 [Moraxellaceae bacterium]